MRVGNGDEYVTEKSCINEACDGKYKEHHYSPDSVNKPEEYWQSGDVRRGPARHDVKSPEVADHTLFCSKCNANLGYAR